MSDDEVLKRIQRFDADMDKQDADLKAKQEKQRQAAEYKRLSDETYTQALKKFRKSRQFKTVLIGHVITMLVIASVVITTTALFAIFASIALLIAILTHPLIGVAFVLAGTLLLTRLAKH